MQVLAQGIHPVLQGRWVTDREEVRGDGTGLVRKNETTSYLWRNESVTERLCLNLGRNKGGVYVSHTMHYVATQYSSHLFHHQCRGQRCSPNINVCMTSFASTDLVLWQRSLCPLHTLKCGSNSVCPRPASPPCVGRGPARWQVK